jgi:hypothetical protein
MIMVGASGRDLEVDQKPCLAKNLLLYANVSSWPLWPVADSSTPQPHDPLALLQAVDAVASDVAAR